MAEAERNDRYVQDSYPILLPESLPDPPAAWVATVGVFQSLGGFRFYQHCSMHSIHVISKGRGTFEYDGRPYKANAGDLTAFFPGQVVRYFDEHSAPWHYLWIRIEGRLAPWIMSQCGFSRQQPVRHTPSAAIHGHLRHLVERVQTAMPPHYPIAWTWQLVDLLARPATAEPPIDLAQACRSLIDDDFNQSVTVDELADRLEVDRATLFRHFRHAYGLSPKQYIDELRLRKAKSLLRDTKLPVKEISLLCGYNSPDYFVRRFRQSSGQPPGRWRDQQA